MSWWKEYRALHNWMCQLRKPRVLVIAGPTCVGKTALSIDLAKELNGEVISADSVQVYRTLDIGSSKIKECEMDGIPHHLINICEPHEEFSCGRFAREARNATQEILSRGKLPIVVGGTGFYLKWYIHGEAKTKKSTKETRQKAHDYLNSMWKEAMDKQGKTSLDDEEKWSIGIEALKRAGDHEAASRIAVEKNNYYRLFRALEVILVNEDEMSNLSVDTTKALDYDFRCFFLHRSRLEIYHRIEHRCEEMLKDGILQEAQELLDAGLLPNTNCATRSVGYRQSMEFLQNIKEGNLELTDEYIRSFILEFESATRKLVKQQMTWYRGNELFQWIDVSCENSSPKQTILQNWSKFKLPSTNREQGLLNKDEANRLKRYQPTLHYYSDAKHRKELLDSVQNLTNL